MPKHRFPRCQIVPLPEDQVAVEIDGIERLRWHFGSGYPRPFFYPLRGPSGAALTRMGHPGAANHDHHRSIWFAHHKVVGIDFWGDNSPARIRQKQWLAYQDGDEEAVMAVLLGWYDGHEPRELIEQELIAAVRPSPDGETLLELQATFRPTSETLEFGKTNFGFLAVRVAKSISEYFGGGRLTDSEMRTGEPAIFGQSARWMDYSGPVQPPHSNVEQEAVVIEGITYFDHPSNSGYPTRWHVREDGWMGAAVCLERAVETTRQAPLTLRYLLHAHAGPIDSQRAETIAAEFAARPGFRVSKSVKKHTQSIVERSAS